MFEQKSDIIFANTKRSLSELIGKAAEAERFEEASRIAKLAQKVDEIYAEWRAVGVPMLPAKGETTKKTQASRSKTKYPFFAKDGDRLIKFGWSKKRKKRYEHKVQFDVVPALADYLLQKIGENVEFKAKQIIPFKAEAKKVPDYQVYLAIAWLRQLGILIKRGRETYLLKLATNSSELKQNFNSLPASVEII